MMNKFLLPICVLAVMGFAARAATTEDIIEMAKKGTPEEQMLREIDSTSGEFQMGATQVIELREARASDKVIAAMLRHTGPEKGVAAAPARPVPPVAPQQPAPLPPVAPRVTNLPPPANPNAPGKLTIDNLDDRTYAYYYEPAIQTLWIAAPNGQAGTVRGHAGETLSMKAGTYQIRFSGQNDAGVSVTVYGGELSAISISRVMLENQEVLQATAYERGERKATGTLASVNALPRDTVVERRVVEVPVYTQSPTYYYGAPTYYYGPSYYYGRPGYYYGPGYYGGSSINFGFNFGGSGHGHYRR